MKRARARARERMINARNAGRKKGRGREARFEEGLDMVPRPAVLFSLFFHIGAGDGFGPENRENSGFWVYFLVVRGLVGKLDGDFGGGDGTGAGDSVITVRCRGEGLR